MPYWLQRQLRRAFLNKDLRQISTLNDCWYLYLKTNMSSKSIESNTSYRRP